MVHYQQWQAPHFRPVNQFYRSQKHKGSASADETVFVALTHDFTGDHAAADKHDLQAAVRLVPYDNYYWLRSLYVRSELRGQGIGYALMQKANKSTSHPIYCFPYNHLQSFYSALGYQILEPEHLPQSLNQLFQRYQRKADNILAMVRPATS